MKSILLYVGNDGGLEARIQCALDLARANDGHITCIHPRPVAVYNALEMYGPAMLMADVAKEMERQADQLQQKIETDFANEGVPWDYVQSAPCISGALIKTSYISGALINASYLSDVIVMSCPPVKNKNPMELGLIGDVVVHTQTPVLVVPEKQNGFDASGTAMVAWNGSFEAAHALQSALPLLARANDVLIVTIGPPKDVRRGDYFPSTAASEYLSRHGVSSELVAEAASKRDVDEAIALIASVRHADYLVMGAYGHSRAREYILGGVTRSMLKTMPVPLLLAH